MIDQGGGAPHRRLSVRASQKRSPSSVCTTYRPIGSPTWSGRARRPGSASFGGWSMTGRVGRTGSLGPVRPCSLPFLAVASSVFAGSTPTLTSARASRGVRHLYVAGEFRRRVSADCLSPGSSGRLGTHSGGFAFGRIACWRPGSMRCWVQTVRG